MMTLADKIKASVATIVSALVTFGVLDAGQSDAVNAVIVAVLTLYAAFSVKPLGPATD